MTHLIAPLAEPYSPQELADFEQLIFASNNDDPKIRLAARATLAVFFREHGKAKCDLMMEKLSQWHDKPQRPDA
ncbi:MAG: hypothetical protein ACXWLZ_06865 [Rhizomicrobium sp.]